MQSPYRQQAREEWDQAYRKAFWNKLLGSLQGRQVDLLDFNEISNRLHLTGSIYRGVQTVPIDKIVGSVGRYNDFNRAFLPRKRNMEERWQAVAMMYLNPASRGLPPIELFKVGNMYFVQDGNHRVSVARQLKIRDIEAYVWEYPAVLPLTGGKDSIERVLMESERTVFLQHTQFDLLRPNHNICLTLPGGYTELLGQIAHYQNVLSEIDEHPIPFEEAVTAWYDMVYETTINILETTGVFTQFPRRTPADFYVWVSQHQRELRECYGGKVMVQDAALDFSQHHKRKGLRGLLYRLRIRLGV
ncbi:MAG: hypothetical protein HY862_03735 [Chloroflexi bacterium]|nr:hypothetical protein [Chloroflexota bacterium]